ncbi:MAG TPA: META domain-containing protein [Candidatus Binatia bacterium]
MSMAQMQIDKTGGPQAPAVAPTGATTPGSPLGREWIFTQVNGYDGALPPSPDDASFVMGRENGRMVGSTSCNPMTAAFEIDLTAGTLRFSNLTNGQAMCSEQQSSTEDAVTDALIATDAFRYSGNSLILMSKGNEVANLTSAAGVHLTAP